MQMWKDVVGTKVPLLPGPADQLFSCNQIISDNHELILGHAGRGGRLGGGTGRGRGQGRERPARGGAGVNGRGGQPNRGQRRRREDDDDEEEHSRGRGRGRTAPR